MQVMSIHRHMDLTVILYLLGNHLNAVVHARRTETGFVQLEWTRIILENYCISMKKWVV